MAKERRKTKRGTSRSKVRRSRPTPKPKVQSIRTPENKVRESSVTLSEGKGSKMTGGSLGGHFWHIFCDGKKAGRVFINMIDEEPLGKHASIQIFLNKHAQGKGIGRIAYRMACEESEYDELYAHMRKSNEASKRAALAAAFEIVEDERINQLVMLWKRH
jgi:RimJ/RimL family protein N-acetyltransferase